MSFRPGRICNQTSLRTPGKERERESCPERTSQGTFVWRETPCTRKKATKYLLSLPKVMETAGGVRKILAQGEAPADDSPVRISARSQRLAQASQASERNRFSAHGFLGASLALRPKRSGKKQPFLLSSFFRWVGSNFAPWFVFGPPSWLACQLARRGTWVPDFACTLGFNWGPAPTSTVNPTF